MPGMAQYHNIPLPKGWPRRIRSAVIQVISLARIARRITRSRGRTWPSRHRLVSLVHYSRAAREEVWTFGYDTVDSPRCKTFETRWLIDDPSIDPMVLSMEATNKSLGQQPVIDRKPS